MISWNIPEVLCKNNENVKAIVLIISIFLSKSFNLKFYLTSNFPYFATDVFRSGKLPQSDN